MIAKEGWFVRRKYTGWGFTPKSWQGWVYVVVLISPFIAMAVLQVSAETQMVLTGVWAIVMVAGFIDIMKSVKKDERELIHEAIAERNALWAILAVIIAGLAYQAASGIAKQAIEIDPVLLVALAVGLIVKASTNIYLDRKD